jgi:hypothetical protein
MTTGEKLWAIGRAVELATIRSGANFGVFRSVRPKGTRGIHKTLWGARLIGQRMPRNFDLVMRVTCKKGVSFIYQEAS